MTSSVRLAISVCLLAASRSLLPAQSSADSNAPVVVIERAPESEPPPPSEREAALRAENQRLTAELSATTRELGSLRARLARVESTQVSSAERDALQQKLSAVEAVLAARTTELQEAQAALTTAAARPIADPAAAEAAQAQLAAEKARADEAASRLNTILGGVERLQLENTALQDQLTSLRATEAALREQVAARPVATPAAPDLSAKLAETEAQLAAATRAQTLLQAENQLLQTASADHARLTAELATLRQQQTAQSEQAPTLNEKIADLENKLATALRSYSLVQAENEQLRSGATGQQALAGELETLRREKADLATRLAAAPAAEVNDRLAQAEDKLATTLRSYSLLQAENEQLKAGADDRTQLLARLETLRQENTALSDRLAAIPAPSEVPPELTARLADLDNKLTTTLRSYSLLSAENERLRNEAAQAVESAQASAARAAGENASQVSALFDELRQTKAQVVSLSADNAQLRTRLALVGPPPGTTLSSPSRPGSAAANAALQASPPPAEPAAALVAPGGGRTHVVVAGDSLAKISRDYYGTPGRWDEILRANTDVIRNENVLPLGAVIRIP